MTPTSPTRGVLLLGATGRTGARVLEQLLERRACLGAMRALVPPARDNQRAADCLAAEVGTDAPFLEWVVVDDPGREDRVGREHRRDGGVR